MGSRSILNILVVAMLLAVSATPLAASFVDNCGSMTDGEMATGAPDRCAGLWASCCDFGPPSSRTTGDAYRDVRATSTPADVLPAMVTTPALLVVAAGNRAMLPDGSPCGLQQALPLDRLTVLRI